MRVVPLVPTHPPSRATRAARATLRWLGHVAATLFWLGAAVLVLLDAAFGPGVKTPAPAHRSPDGQHLLHSTIMDPGAFGRSRRSFGLRRTESNASLISYLELNTPDSIRIDWIDASSVQLSQVPLADVTSIRRTNASSARMLVRFKQAS